VELLGAGSTARFAAMEIGGTPGASGVEKLLFESRGSGLTVPLQNIFLYGVTQNGQRFLVDTVPSIAPQSLELILKWPGSAK
jgi:hypothetical protein